MQGKKVEEECQRCRGVGYVIYEKEGQKTVVVCPLCGGRKKTKETYERENKF